MAGHSQTNIAHLSPDSLRSHIYSLAEIHEHGVRRQAPLGQVVQYGGPQQAAAADHRVGLFGQWRPLDGAGLVPAAGQPDGTAGRPGEEAQQRERHRQGRHPPAQHSRQVAAEGGEVSLMLVHNAKLTLLKKNLVFMLWTSDL